MFVPVSTTFAGASGAAPARIKFDPAEVCARGEAWLTEHADTVEALPHGTTIALNIASGTFVKAASGLEAMDLFEEAFGPDAQAWVYQIGAPVFGDGGIWSR